MVLIYELWSAFLAFPYPLSVCVCVRNKYLIHQTYIMPVLTSWDRSAIYADCQIYTHEIPQAICWQYTIHADCCRKIRICPIGEGIGMGIYNSLYLALADPKSLLPGMKIFADFTLRILDQVYGWKHQYAKRNCQLLVCLFVFFLWGCDAIKSSFDKTSGGIKLLIVKFWNKIYRC